MRRRLLSLGVVVLFVACGFPSVEYDNGGDGGGGDASPHPDGPVSAEGSGDDDAVAGDDAIEARDATGDDSDSSATSDTGTDAPVTDGSGTVDASDATVDAPSESGADAPTDAPADVRDAGVDAPPVCDFDMDTYKVEGVAACGTGNDCCDTDNQAHPGQTTYFTTADACMSFDYNCNGTVDLEYPVNLKCGGTGLTGCTGGSAFLGNPACGTSGLYGTCVPNGALACQAGNEMSLVQGCH